MIPSDDWFAHMALEDLIHEITQIDLKAIVNVGICLGRLFQDKYLCTYFDMSNWLLLCAFDDSEKVHERKYLAPISLEILASWPKQHVPRLAGPFAKPRRVVEVFLWSAAHSNFCRTNFCKNVLNTRMLIMTNISLKCIMKLTQKESIFTRIYIQIQNLSFGLLIFVRRIFICRLFDKNDMKSTTDIASNLTHYLLEEQTDEWFRGCRSWFFRIVWINLP